MDAIPGPKTGMETSSLAAVSDGSWPPQMMIVSAPSFSLWTTLRRIPGAASSISAWDSTESGAFLVVTSLSSVQGEAWIARDSRRLSMAPSSSPEMSITTSIWTIGFTVMPSFFE